MTQAKLFGTLQYPDAAGADDAVAAVAGAKIDGDRVSFDVRGEVADAAIERILARAVTGSIAVTSADGTERTLTALGRTFWQKRWDDGQTGWHEGAANDLLVRHFEKLALAPASRVLVPLAGKSVDVSWIAERGHEVIGIELSMTAIEAFFAERTEAASARTKVGRHDAMSSKGITLVCADIFDLDVPALGTFDAIYDRAALVALEPSTRAAYVDGGRALLKRDGRTLLVAFAYDGQRELGPLGPPWSIDEATVRTLYSREKVEKLETRPTSVSPRLAAAGVKSIDESAYLIRR